jgi:chromosome segregation ATPase
VIAVLAAFLTTSAFAQEQPVSPKADAARSAEQKTEQWNVLASTLEQRLARILPCDARVKSAIEEVSRASDVRFAALSASWQEMENRSQEQEQIAAKFAGQNETLLAPWKSERSDAQQAQAALEEHEADLRESARTLAALATAARALDGIAADSEAVTKQSTEREDALAQWSASWNEVVRASKLRDAAIENELKTLANERDRWTAFYAARTARAQMECSLTGANRAAAPKTTSPRATDKGANNTGDKKKQ